MCGGYAHSLREEFRCSMLGLDHQSPQLFVKSQWLRGRWYLAWTVVWAAWFVATLCYEPYDNTNKGWRYFEKLTNITYLVLGMAAILDFVVCVHVNCRRTDIMDGNVDHTTWYIRVLFNVGNMGSIVVTILYYTTHKPVNTFADVYSHMITSIYTVTTLIFAAKPVRLLHVYQPVIYSAIYLLFTIVYHGIGEPPLYSIIDWSKPGTTVGVCALIVFAAVPIVHVLNFCIYKLRVFVSEKCGCSEHLYARFGEDTSLAKIDAR